MARKWHERILGAEPQTAWRIFCRRRILGRFVDQIAGRPLPDEPSELG